VETGIHNPIVPETVIAELQKHLLLDGFRVVIDLERSRGCCLVDAVTGRELLDLYGFYGSLPIGYNHPHFSRPEVRQDLLRAARTKVANSDVYSVPYARFVETFSRVVGLPPLERYFFIDGGALGVENALKAAMDWKVRKNLAAGRGERGTEIVHFEKAFHGRSGYTLSLTNTDPNKTRYFAQFKWPRFPAPVLDFHLPEREREAAVQIVEERVGRALEGLLAEKGADIAALIIEPIQGEGGDRHFRGEWLRMLRRMCDEHEVLLIYDEVQTGMGLTGRNWCCEHFEVWPDLLVFGKKAQVCGVMAGPRLDEVSENCFRLSGRLNSTWGSNLVDMVRCTHYLKVMEEEGLVPNAASMGVRFLEGLRALAAEEELITAPRGRGLMLALDLPDQATRDQFYRGLFDLGCLAIRSGERSIRFRPVLDIGAEEIDRALESLAEACRRVRAGQKLPPGMVNIPVETGVKK